MKKKLNILWVSHLLPYPPVGGVRIRSYYLLRETSKYNTIHFVGLSQKTHQPSIEEFNKAVNALDLFCGTVSVNSFESYSNKLLWLFLVTKSFFSKKSYKENWAYSKSLKNNILHIIESNNIDVIHFDTISLLQYHKYVPISIPIIINHHNVESNMLSRRAKNNRNIFKKIYFKIEARKIAKLEKKFCPLGSNLVVSDLDKDRLAETCPEIDIHIIANGVDLGHFSPIGATYIENSLIWVGGLTWYPNLEAVMFFCREVWPLLVEQVDNAKLYIVGKNPPEALRRLVSRYDNLELLGFVDDIRPLMSSVSASICPIKDGGGTRLKVLNTMAMGVPLIATKMSCEGVPVTNGVDVLFAETPDEYVDKIISVFQNKAMRLNLSQNSRKLIKEKFDFHTIGEKLNSVYQSVSNRNSNP